MTHDRAYKLHFLNHADVMFTAWENIPVNRKPPHGQGIWPERTQKNTTVPSDWSEEKKERKKSRGNQN